MSMASILLFAPYFVFAWLNSRAWTKNILKDSFILQISHYEIYLGRIPTPSHLKNHYVAFFDCCAELPTSSKIQRQQFYSLDLIPLSANQLAIAVEHFSQLIQQYPHETSYHQKIHSFPVLQATLEVAVFWRLICSNQVMQRLSMQPFRCSKCTSFRLSLKDVQRQQLHLYQLNPLETGGN